MTPITLPGTQAHAIDAALEALETNALIVAELAARADDETLYRVWRKVSARARFIDTVASMLGDEVDARQTDKTCGPAASAAACLLRVHDRRRS